MNLDASAFRDDEIEVLRTGEISDAGVSNVGRFVSSDNIVPCTHLSLLLNILFFFALHTFCANRY